MKSTETLKAKTCPWVLSARISEALVYLCGIALGLAVIIAAQGCSTYPRMDLGGRTVEMQTSASTLTKAQIELVNRVLVAELEQRGLEVCTDFTVEYVAPGSVRTPSTPLGKLPDGTPIVGSVRATKGRFGSSPNVQIVVSKPGAIPHEVIRHWCPTARDRKVVYFPECAEPEGEWYELEKAVELAIAAEVRRE